MTKPTSFITTSDYATLKNDAGSSGTVTVPASFTVGAANTKTYTTNLTLGSTGSINRVQISSSKDSNTIYSTGLHARTRTGSLGAYTIYSFVTRTSATNLQLTCIIPNPYGATLTGASGDETFTFYVNTFLPPFS